MNMLLRLLAVCMLASQAFAFRSVFSNSRALAGLSRASPSSLQSSSKEIPTTTEGWKTILSPSQFEVLRRKATEPPGYSEGKEGELEYVLKEKYGTKYPKEGTYACAGCGTPLYAAKSKFDSGCGWPAYYEGLPGAITELPDADGRRIEIVCSKCGGHLGHVFKGEGFPTPTNERHCVNGISLTYEPASSE